MIATANAASASGRLSSRPPLASGLSRKSPTVAPSGRVRMKAAQNRSYPADARREIERGQHRQRGAEDQGAAPIAKARIGHPVAKRCAERLREGDGDPVEGLGARRGDGVYVDRAQRPVPGEQ